MHWIKTCKENSLPRQGARLFRLDRERIAVFRTSDNLIFALESRCPHMGGPLEEGIVHGCKVTCPLHSQHFDLRTGKAVWPDQGRVHVYPVQIRGEDVYVGIGRDVSASGYV